MITSIQQKIKVPALRYHGGKFRLASWIIKNFPPHRCYVEPFGGAGSVLLKKPRAYAEVYNDLDGDIVNFFRVVRDPEQCQRLIDALILTPYAREEFEQAYQDCEDSVERARRVAIRAQMGFGSAGATKGTTGFRVDTKRPYGTSQHLWERYPSALSTICERLRGVLVENSDAIKVIHQHDAEDTLFFVDPPYLLSTRVIRSGDGYYRHEMNDIQHADLLCSLKSIKGMAVVSGYASDLYADLLSDWKTVTKTARASAFRGTKLAEETIWINPACVDAIRQQGAMAS